ncbi:stalk domain-containing protein [Paenibacillus bovis]|uniref:Copper amine oxidase-like N-terminal domain-containing protein n=1 Tax=Paenibacillus bovis TaxID=1616788 RepID=A0A172ZHL8_9BACL|nr:stalk domain-containing protein [Paenibacillus bovis]ANF97134.1 hypothetical protein AR543_14730 [Paenibacillus bovis]
MTERKRMIHHLAVSSALSLTLVAGSVVLPWMPVLSVAAADTTSSNLSIVAVIDGDNYLLSDGSIWAKSIKGPWHSQYNFKGITKGTNNHFYGWTEGGQVMSWDTVTGKTEIVDGVNNAAQVAGNGIILGRDGKIRLADSHRLDTPPNNIKLIDGFEDSYAALKNSGDVFYYKSSESGLGRRIGNYPDAVSIRQDGVALAVLRSDGSVTLHDLLAEESPKVIAQDAVSMAWQGSSRTLLVVKKDGTVWSCSRASGFAPEQLTELSDIREVTYGPEGIYARRNDGSWVLDNRQNVTAFNVPSIMELKLVLSKTDAAVGDKIEAQVQEVYSNGYISSRPAQSEELKVDPPQIAEVLSDGSLKVKAIGGAAVTLNADGRTAQATLNGASEEALTGALLIDGIVYLPVQSVFKALGASVAVNGNQFAITWGKDRIVLNKNSAAAKINDQPVTMKGKVQIADGQTVFPAALLTSIASSAKVSWDARYKQAVLNVNGSKVTVQSADTQRLIKQGEIGNLTRLLGKSYWINGYSGAGDRFSKVTIADINAEKDPYNRTRFVVHFRGANGKDYPSDQMTANEITELLSDSSQFFTYSPSSKYNWSASTWTHIQNGEVVRGMTKQQVLFAWGEPDRKEVSRQDGHVIEVWSYISGNSLDMLGFGDGVVYEIFSI